MTDDTDLSSGEPLFFQGMEGLLPLYLEIKRLITGLSPGIQAKVQKTQISFLLHRPFAWVWLPPRQGIRGRPAHYLILSFASAEEVQSPSVKDRVPIRPGLYTNHIILSEIAQINGELAGLLRSSLALRNPNSGHA